MTHGSLFSGIGGFDLAAEWAGWQNVFHCELNDFGKKVLQYYWPKSISYDDITKTDFTIHRGTIDVLTGGFPCQPYSAAGKRRGKDDPRHLWPQMLRAIREIRPRWVVGENVRGLTNWNGGLVFDEVQADLEAAGYEVTPFLLPACAVDAPHRRDRIWFVAKNTVCDGWPSCERQSKSGIGQQWDVSTGDNEQLSTNNGKVETTTYAHLHGCERGNCQNEQHTSEEWKHAQHDIEQAFVANAKSDRNRRELYGVESANGGIRESQKCGENDLQFRDNGKKRATTNCSNTRIKSVQQPRQNTIFEFKTTSNASHTRLQGSEQYRSFGSKRQIKANCRQFSGSVCGKWEQFPTQSPVCGRNDGLSGKLDGITFPKWRNESIKAYGNAIVPQVAYQIFKAINQYEHLS